jgi:hypothetical protein
MNARSAGYWTTTALTALVFLTGGAAYLSRADAPAGHGGALSVEPHDHVMTRRARRTGRGGLDGVAVRPRGRA